MCLTRRPSEIFGVSFNKVGRCRLPHQVEVEVLRNVPVEIEDLHVDQSVI